MEWQVDRMCTDVEDYELMVEKQKRQARCEQACESWKWSVSYHGSIVASGNVNDTEEAKALALQNVPCKGDVA